MIKPKGEGLHAQLNECIHRACEELDAMRSLLEGSFDLRPSSLHAVVMHAENVKEWMLRYKDLQAHERR